MEVSLGVTGLLARFEGRIFSASQVPRGKPFPDLFLHAATAMNEQPFDSIVVEDAVPGVQAAKAAGMRRAGLCRCASRRSRRYGLTAGVDPPFDDMNKLPGLVLK